MDCGTVEAGAILAQIPGTIVYQFTQVLSCIYTGWVGRVTITAGTNRLRCVAIRCSAILTQLPGTAVRGGTIVLGCIGTVHVTCGVLPTTGTLWWLARTTEIRIVTILTWIPGAAKINTGGMGSVGTGRCRPRGGVTAGTGW